MRLGVALFACVLSGCATFGFRLDDLRMHSMLVDARGEGFTLADPLEIDSAMRETVEVQIGHHGTELERLHRLNRWLRGEYGLGFKYDANATRTAKEAFYARRGDCLSYAHLFTALARQIGVSMGYVRYREAQSYDERNGQFTVVSHVASVFSNYRMTVLVELNGVPESYRMSDYETLGDDEAAALHASNLAMEAFERGERDVPEKVLRFLSARTPNLPEVHNNLAAVLLRRGRAHEALAVVKGAIGRFPDFVPLYVNGALAARREGEDAQSEEWAEKARAADPFMPFVKGTWLFEKGKYAAAEQLIGRARSMRPQSVVFTAWLARVEWMAGKRDEARAMFAEARRLAPTAPVLDEVTKRVPELGAP
jgi:tetratricopeptide (TPR) repeat protein